MNGNPTPQYETRQAAADQNYRRQYRAWVQTLPQEDRQTLKAKGLSSPLIDYHASESVRDISERNISLEPAFQVYPAPETQKRWYEAFQRFVILVIDSTNPRLEGDICAFTIGLYAREGKSGTELAAKYGLSRAAWSKRCKRLQEHLDLPPSRGMKSEAACRTYTVTNGATPKWIR